MRQNVVNVPTVIVCDVLYLPEFAKELVIQSMD